MPGVPHRQTRRAGGGRREPASRGRRDGRGCCWWPPGGALAAEPGRRRRRRRLAAGHHAPGRRPTVERRDLVQTEEVDGRLGYGDSFAVAGNGGVITALPAVGPGRSTGASSCGRSTAQRGPILLFGTRPMWRRPRRRRRRRTRRPPAGGEPRRPRASPTRAVLTVDEEFTDATADAVERWQEALGLERDRQGRSQPGRLQLGPVRVAERKVQPGAEATARC